MTAEHGQPAPPLRLERSFAAWEKARRVLFEGTSTYSKLPRFQSFGTAPILAARASGAWMWDVDDNRYLDLAAGVGAILLGHAHPQVTAAVSEALRLGNQLSLGSPLETEVAERLVDLVPSAEQVRFMKTGAEAVAAGVRIARAHTGRSLVIRGAYHGWHDWAMAGTGPGRGVPAELADWVVPVCDPSLEEFRRLAYERSEELALICVEPVGFAPPAEGFLSGLRALADETGALLLFDEVSTGFRFGVGGAQERFGVTPDLATFGKALSNGFPLAALVGRADLLAGLTGRVFISSTLAGETTSLAAARAVLDELEKTDALERIERAGRAMRAILERCGDLGEGYRLTCHGFPCRFVLAVEGPDAQRAHLIKSLFYQEMVRRSIFLARVCFPCAAIGEEELSEFTRATEQASDVLRSAVHRDLVGEWLQGEALGEVPVL